MAWGVSGTAAISRTTNNSVQVAEKLNQLGDIEESRTHGGNAEVTEEVFTDSFTNLATNGQTGSVGSGVVVSHELVESNTDWQRARKVTRTPLTAATTTTTTTAA